MADPAPISSAKKVKRGALSSIKSNDRSVAASAASPRNTRSRERSRTPSPTIAPQSFASSAWGAAAEPAPIIRASEFSSKQSATSTAANIINEEKTPKPTEVDIQQPYPESHPLNPKHPYHKKATDPNRTHRGWHKIVGYVIKCDVCEQRAPGALHECDLVSCHQRICLNCALDWAYIKDGRLDPHHYIDPDDHDWSPPQRKKPAPKPSKGPRKRSKQSGRSPLAATPEPAQPRESRLEAAKRQIDDEDVQEISPPKKRLRKIPSSDEDKTVSAVAPPARMEEDLTDSHGTSNVQDAEEMRCRRIRAAIAAAPNNVEFITDDDSDHHQNKGKKPESKADFSHRGNHRRSQEFANAPSYNRGNQGVDQGPNGNLHPSYIDSQRRGDYPHDREEKYQDRARLDENSLTTRQRIVLYFLRQIFLTDLTYMPRSFQRPITTIPEVWNAPPPRPQVHDIYGMNHQGHTGYPISSERGAPQHHPHNYRTPAELLDEEVYRRITNAWASNSDLHDECRQWGSASGLQLLWEVFEVRRDTIGNPLMNQTVRWFIAERDHLRLVQDEATWGKLRPLGFQPLPRALSIPRPTPPRQMREETTAVRRTPSAPGPSPFSEEPRVQDPDSDLETEADAEHELE
ncbi:hypothetical protein QBC43DRAFT_77198 [Cladorrhinum sp. PSN259]|nr:hypothetical protein QBC43DRAFT_77198 [Cladorrhinum sp. PSN259]